MVLFKKGQLMTIPAADALIKTCREKQCDVQFIINGNAAWDFADREYGK